MTMARVWLIVSVSIGCMSNFAALTSKEPYTSRDIDWKKLWISVGIFCYIICFLILMLAKVV